MRKSFSTALIIASLAVGACSHKSPHAERKDSKAPEAAATHEAQTAKATEAEGAKTSDEPASKEAPAAKPIQTHPAPLVVKIPSANVAEEKKAVDPEKSLGWLKNGNIRYVKHHLRKDGQSKADIERLSKGQAPHAIVLSCSDSRVPPEIVFDQKLGEIFVVRNAGEIPDQASIASIEYAVEHLGSRLLVVMGHSSCGAVKAALGTLNGGDAGSPALNALVHDIHPRLASFKGKTQSPGVEDESFANARGISKDLLGRSQILREKVASGDLVIKTALYHLDNGKVDFDQ